MPQDDYPSRLGDGEKIIPRPDPVIHGSGAPTGRHSLSARQLSAFERDGFLLRQLSAFERDGFLILEDYLAEGAERPRPPFLAERDPKPLRRWVD